MKKDFEYTTIFSSVIKPMVSEDKDKYLSLASQLDIESFVPGIDTEKEIDLLPIAFNACVANRVNRNGDVIDTETALDIFKSFINKPINIEHNRQKVIGVILSAGFSEFGTDQVLDNESLSKESLSPFNITLGGVVWKVVNNQLADVIEESNDPTSDKYMSISASWELGFSQYNLVLTEGGDKNLESSTIISDQAEIESLKPNLKAFGGTGETQDGRSIYRKVIGQVVPLGIGLTETPAADVKGVIVSPKSSKDPESDSEATVSEKEISEEKTEKTVNIISQSEEINVKNKKRVIMKIESLKDITDENLKELSASSISDFIEDELQKASEEYVAQKTEVENNLKAAQEQIENLQKNSEETQKTFESVQAELEKIKEEVAAKEAEERFVARMTYFDKEYVLEDGDREIIAFDIKDMDDDNFETYSKKMGVLLSAKNRESLETAEAEVTQEAQASEEVETEEEPVASTDVVEEAEDNSEAEASEIPVSSDTEEQTTYDKYKNAFSVENWIK